MCPGWKNSPCLTDVDDSILVGVLSSTFKLSQKHLVYCKRKTLANFCLKKGRADRYHDSEKKILYQGANSQVPVNYVHRTAPINKATVRRCTRMPTPAAQASGLSQRLPGCRDGIGGWAQPLSSPWPSPRTSCTAPARSSRPRPRPRQSSTAGPCAPPPAAGAASPSPR